MLSTGNKINIDWADMPLTAEEEAGLIQGRKNIKSGDFIKPRKNTPTSISGR